MTGTAPALPQDAVPPGGPATSAGRPPRSLAPDLARGMMLLFIVLANVSWHLYDRPVSGMSVHLLEGSTLDKVLQSIMLIAVDARSYPMFAFLFGYGMVQFMRSRQARGVPEVDARRMLRRRHWWMLALGFCHAALLFAGDVLGAYAIAGLLLVWLFFRRTDRTLRIWAIVIAALLLISTVLSLFGGVMMTLFAPPEVSGADAYDMGFARELTAGASPYWASAIGRVIGWLFITPSQLIGGAIPLCILLGWLAARHRLLEDPGRHRRLVTGLAVGGILVGWLGGVPAALLNLGVLPIPSGASWIFSGLTPTTGIAGGIGYAMAFALLAARWQASPPAAVRAISAVGQRSLTFYLFQSVVLAPLLGAWGFGLGAHLSTAQALGIAALVWLVSIPLAVWLDRSGRRGPAEALLRRLTYGKIDPLTPRSRPPRATPGPAPAGA
ncbi:DUF418 domain-containing protein [Brachybacterium sp. AOP25-B2-12]|uniref:DUF418 domain-containing protein n=1 Tax=Brachybacterium sp. AOP25-B2-12 TaxID=3457710 RepID=UPI004034E2A7